MANVDNLTVLDARGYQVEMLHESLKKNIVVAMDTGSGKTHIAILRIEAELERCAHNKFIWFLCPNVVLAQQQHKYISTHLPSIQCRILTGNDGVDRWSEQHIWDTVLENIRIVVSTHQVLLEALIHGFVGMVQIALLIFDEAHHCISNHPANRILREFYHPALTTMRQVPHILGLTASPTFSGKGGGIQKIEQNMNAISRTPKLHRSELLRYVHQPQVVMLTFSVSDRYLKHPPLLQKLNQLYQDADIMMDPYVTKLRAEGHGADSRQLSKATLNRKTYCQDQLKSLVGMAMILNDELGSWASERYIASCVARFRGRRFNGPVNFDSLNRDEWIYLNKILSSFPSEIPAATDVPETSGLSLKVQRLIDCLVDELAPSFSGLLFTQTRASVGLLADIISNHPRTKDKIEVGTFLGTSNSEKRKSHIGDLYGLKDQSETLNELKSGSKNLIVATSVLEEGIDVSACNMVICFEKPPNLKSFIQRRGRARSMKSKYIIMFEEGSDDVLKTWEQFEEHMKQMYMDEMRILENIRKQECEEEEEGTRTFRVESTGAQMNMQDAIGHLHHWCAALPKAQYADSRPVFLFEELSTNDIRARVILPKSVDQAVREAQGSTWWKSERLAKQDAAYNAYVALYHARLVNDNLLPLIVYDEAALEAYSEIEKRPSLITVKPQYSPWPAIAAAWRSGSICKSYILSFSSNQSSMPPLRMISPITLPKMTEINLFTTSYSNVKIDIDYEDVEYYESDIMLSENITKLLLYSIYQGRMRRERSGFALLFEPLLELDNRHQWLENSSGCRPAIMLLEHVGVNEDVGLVRDLHQNGKPHILHGIEQHVVKSEEASSANATEIAKTEAYLKVSKLPKRRDYLHAIPSSNTPPNARAATYLPLNTCTVDNLPFAYSQLALYIPSIMHHVENALITEHLCRNLLASIGFQDRHLVTTAITAPVARESYDYQQLEFLGDCCLKLYTSINLMALHSNWHEGYLSHQKDHIVSNGNLAVAAGKTGLDQYIITKPFTGNKWRPLYNDDFNMDGAVETRQLSTKTLADVVEALIGAAFLDGGHSRTLTCLGTFLPEISWQSLETCREILAQTPPPNESTNFPPEFIQLEALVSHTFVTKSLLVEALTHPSHLGPDITPSYDRLEYLGDSILDFIVTLRIFSHPSSLSTPRMHLLRTALVNANFLAFLCISRSILVSHNPLPPVSSDSESTTLEAPRELSIYHFMRHNHSIDLINTQSRCQARFTQLQPAIRTALDYGSTYPWSLLSTLAADKFFSDLIESILAAIYVDSGGSLSSCEQFLSVLGLIPYLERALNEGLHVLHPKEELGVLAGNDKVKYELVIGKDEVGGDVVTEGYSINVWVGERQVGCARGSQTRIEAETKAAEEATKLLKKEQMQARQGSQDRHEALPNNIADFMDPPIEKQESLLHEDFENDNLQMNE